MPAAVRRPNAATPEKIFAFSAMDGTNSPPARSVGIHVLSREAKPDRAATAARSRLAAMRGEAALDWDGNGVGAGSHTPARASRCARIAGTSVWVDAGKALISLGTDWREIRPVRTFLLPAEERARIPASLGRSLASSAHTSRDGVVGLFLSRPLANNAEPSRTGGPIRGLGDPEHRHAPASKGRTGLMRRSRPGRSLGQSLTGQG